MIFYVLKKLVYYLYLLSNPQKHKLFKKQAQLQAKKFDLESVVDSYERIYNDAVASINY